jgi:hypothetical protein
MSSIAVNAITDASAGNTATINSVTPNTSNVLGKNRIINGNMVIDQRNAGAAVTASGNFPVDRFIVTNSTDGAFSAQRDSSAPVGFVNSVKVTTTTADGTLTTTQNLQFSQRIEGTNVADLGWGTASAAPVTLSFWVRSSLTGTFGGSLRNNDGTRSYPYTYTISVADTWEQKTVTVAGDTSGTWLTTTGIGLIVFFGLGAGPYISGTAGAWAGTNYISATGAVSVIGTLNATWYITGVQLEAGSSATEFEHRQYGTELSLCQRYCPTWATSGVNNNFPFFGQAYAAGSAVFLVSYPVKPRVAATGVTTSGTFASSNAAYGIGGDFSSVTIYGPNLDMFGLNCTGSSGLVAGNATGFVGSSATSLIIATGCEL